MGRQCKGLGTRHVHIARSACRNPYPSAAPTIPVHQLGEAVDVTGHRITLTAVENANGVVKANFLIENTGNVEITVSSMMSFMAKNISGVKLDQDYMCGASLDGSVLPGDKLKGDICWKTGGATPIWLYYELSAFSGGAIVWVTQ